MGNTDKIVIYRLRNGPGTGQRIRRRLIRTIQTVDVRVHCDFWFHTFSGGSIFKVFLVNSIISTAVGLVFVCLYCMIESADCFIHQRFNDNS